MRSKEEYRQTVSARLDEAVEYYDRFASGSDSLSFAQQQTFEFRRLFEHHDTDELRKKLGEFEGIDESRYGSVFALTVKLLSEYLDADAVD